MDLYNPWNPQLDSYDIFHCFAVMPGVLEMCDYAKKRGLKLVISPNLWVTKKTKDNYPFNYIWNLLSLADKVVVNSDVEGHQLSDIFSFDVNKFWTVYNGVENDFLAGVNPDFFREKFSQRREYVLNVANIEPRKNQLRFIEAIKNYPELDFVVIGHVRDHEYAQACLQAANGQVRILEPMIYGSRMLRSAYAGCRFFAMPSLLETPSIAALEAAATGACILITAEGSAREYFDSSVTYVDPESIDSMRQGIAVALHANNEGSAWVVRHQFMWEQSVDSLVNCYQHLLES